MVNTYQDPMIRSLDSFHRKDDDSRVSLCLLRATDIQSYCVIAKSGNASEEIWAGNTCDSFEGRCLECGVLC